MEYAVREYGSEYHWHANEDFWLPEGQQNMLVSGAQTYRSGRDALKAVAAACVGKYDRILLPALCCESMVTPFAMYGITPVFYRLNPDYTASVADIESKMDDHTILLYQAYFGIAPFEKESLFRLRQMFSKALFLEDRTQNLIVPREEDSLADVTIASVRKWTAIPDGGLLWSKSMVFPNGERKGAFAQLRRSAMEQKTTYLSTGEETLKARYRQMLAQASDLLDKTAKPCAMEEDSVSILERLDTAKMLACRQRNVRVLQRLLQDVVTSGQVQFVTDRPEQSTLYFPILVQGQEKLQRTLALQGIYCPVIWPVSEQARGVCPVAEYTADHILGVPCDHRYSEEDMECIAQQIERLCNEQ